MASSLGTAGSWLSFDRPLRPEDPTMAAVTLDVIRVHGGTRLDGSVNVTGAKNSALKLMAAALLAEGRTVLHNVPQITDMAIMAEVLRRVGCEVHTDGPGTLVIDTPGEPGHETDYELVRRLRASICVLG